MNENKVSLREFTKEEIDIFLAGDRREIDRLLLYGLNNIAHILIPHMEAEVAISEVLGTPKEVAARVAWIDAQISKQKVKNKMMAKVAESTVGWALVAFLGFLAYATWDYVVDLVKKAH